LGCRGKSASIQIQNERDRLSQEEIERAVMEAEKFAEEDAQLRKRVEAANTFSSFVGSVKNQLADKEGLGGKVSGSDKAKLKDTLAEAEAWLDENGQEASMEDLEEKLAGEFVSRPGQEATTDQRMQRCKGKLAR
jgi:endoplasmic reticulum chaperone BiP